MLLNPSSSCAILDEQLMKNYFVSKNLNLHSVTALLKELEDLVFPMFETTLYKRMKMLLQAARLIILEKLCQALSLEKV